MSTSEGIKLKQTLWKSEAKKAMEFCAAFDHSGGSKISKIHWKNIGFFTKLLFFLPLETINKKM